MFTKSYIPHKGYWSSPFARWQGSLQNIHSIELGAATAKRFLALRGYTPDIFDGVVLGMTVGQKKIFHAAPWFCAQLGNDRITGPLISQACATSAACIFTAASRIETDTYQCILATSTDRASNSPHSVWPNPNGPGGQPIYEDWFMDNLTCPYGGVEMVQTAEWVAQDYGGITKEQADEMAIRRYEQYLMAMANDRAFQKEYMLPIEHPISKKQVVTLDADEGIRPHTKEGMASLKPVIEGGCITYAAQTHPADGNAGLIVTTKENAKALSKDKNITIQILSYGFARAKKARMAAAVAPSAEMALKNAGIEVKDLKAVKTHNPFSVNDIVMGGVMNIPPEIFNNYGSSLIWGHPQGPTGARATIELIEELIKIGGGYGLFAGCAAGDSAASLVVKVS
ncbi:MAG: thiolase family protein [Dehalococcoidales bacterium]|nr:thiolase family protein [Dehalococcoidales bacterium]